MTAALASDDPVPLGPYRVEMTYDFTGKKHTPPYTIVASNGQTIAGHVESRAAAELIRDRLNATGEPLSAAEGRGEQPPEAAALDNPDSSIDNLSVAQLIRDRLNSDPDVSSSQAEASVSRRVSRDSEAYR